MHRRCFVSSVKKNSLRHPAAKKGKQGKTEGKRRVKRGKMSATLSGLVFARKNPVYTPPVKASAFNTVVCSPGFHRSGELSCVSCISWALPIFQLQLNRKSIANPRNRTQALAP